MTHQLKNILTPGDVYLGDNGEAVCRECAGVTAQCTGRDLSGQPMLSLASVPAAELQAYRDACGGVISCERGCTTL